MQQQHNQVPQSFQQQLQKSGAIATYDLQNPPKYASYLVRFVIQIIKPKLLIIACLIANV